MSDYQIDILDQQALPACSAYAIAGVANYFLKKQGSLLRVDTVKLNDESAKDRGAASINQEMNHVIQNGLPLSDGTRIKIKNFTYINNTISAIEEALKIGPLVFGYNVMDGDPFSDRVDPFTFVLRAPQTSHAMVIVGYQTFMYRIANSWGTEWKDKGYFWMPSVQLNSNRYNLGIFSFIL